MLPDLALPLFLVLTGILPVGTQSGADSEARQDEAVHDEPPRNDQYEKQPFIHYSFPLFFRLSPAPAAAVSDLLR